MQNRSGQATTLYQKALGKLHPQAKMNPIPSTNSTANSVHTVHSGIWLRYSHVTVNTSYCLYFSLFIWLVILILFVWDSFVLLFIFAFCDYFVTIYCYLFSSPHPLSLFFSYLLMLYLHMSKHWNFFLVHFSTASLYLSLFLSCFHLFPKFKWSSFALHTYFYYIQPYSSILFPRPCESIPPPRIGKNHSTRGKSLLLYVKYMLPVIHCSTGTNCRICSYS